MGITYQITFVEMEKSKVTAKLCVITKNMVWKDHLKNTKKVGVFFIGYCLSSKPFY